MAGFQSDGLEQLGRLAVRAFPRRNTRSQSRAKSPAPEFFAMSTPLQLPGGNPDDSTPTGVGVAE